MSAGRRIGNGLPRRSSLSPRSPSVRATPSWLSELLCIFGADPGNHCARWLRGAGGADHRGHSGSRRPVPAMAFRLEASDLLSEIARSRERPACSRAHQYPARELLRTRSVPQTSLQGRWSIRPRQPESTHAGRLRRHRIHPHRRSLSWPPRRVPPFPLQVVPRPAIRKPIRRREQLLRHRERKEKLTKHHEEAYP